MVVVIFLLLGFLFFHLLYKSFHSKRPSLGQQDIAYLSAKLSNN